jgi:nucleotide-binding universal stress UspA family protein
LGTEEVAMSYTPEATIVVGVDGSDRSVDALTWAAAQARAVGATLKVVTAWHFPEVLDHRPARAESELSAAVEDHIGRLVSESCENVGYRTVIQEDDPSELLLREAKGADLVVLAGHGDGSVHDVGSVTLAVLQRAGCPVVVVPSGT